MLELEYFTLKKSAAYIIEIVFLFKIDIYSAKLNLTYLEACILY